MFVFKKLLVCCQFCSTLRTCVRDFSTSLRKQYKIIEEKVRIILKRSTQPTKSTKNQLFSKEIEVFTYGIEQFWCRTADQLN